MKIALAFAIAIVHVTIGWAQESLMFKTGLSNSTAGAFYVADLPTISNGRQFWNQHVVNKPTDIVIYDGNSNGGDLIIYYRDPGLSGIFSWNVDKNVFAQVLTLEPTGETGLEVDSTNSNLYYFYKDAVFRYNLKEETTIMVFNFTYEFVQTGSYFKLKIDSTSQNMYFSYWGDRLTIAKCQLASNGTCTSFLTLNQSSDCSEIFYLATCLDIDEQSNKLLYCFCANEYGQLDVFESDLDGKHPTCYNLASYIPEGTFLAGALYSNGQMVAFSLGEYASESYCTVWSGDYYGEGVGVGPIECKDAAFTRNGTMYLVGYVGSRDINLNTITMGAIYYTLNPAEAGAPAVIDYMSYAPNLFTVNATGPHCSFWMVDTFRYLGIENMPLHASPVLLNGPQQAVTNSSYNTNIASLTADPVNGDIFFFNEGPNPNTQWDESAYWFLQVATEAVQSEAYQLLNNSVRTFSPQKVFLDSSKTWAYFLSGDYRIMRVNRSSSVEQQPEVCVDWWCCGDYWYPPQLSGIMNFYIRDDWIYYTVVADWGAGLNPLPLTVVLKTTVDCKGQSVFAASNVTQQTYDNGNAFFTEQVEMVQSPSSNNSYYTFYPVDPLVGPNFHTALASIEPPVLTWYTPLPFTPGTVRVDPEEKYLYYPSTDDGTLWQCTVASNATDCTMLPLSSLVLPRAMYLDDKNGLLYYWDLAYQTIMKAKFGQGYPTQPEPVVSLQPPGTKNPDINFWGSYMCDITAIALDSENGFLYFTNDTGLYKVNIDQQSPQVQTVNGSASGGGLAIDIASNQVIWGATNDLIETSIMTNDLTTGEMKSYYPTTGRWELPVNFAIDEQTGMPFYSTQSEFGGEAQWKVYKCADSQCKNATMISTNTVENSPIECLIGFSLDSTSRTFYALWQCEWVFGIWLVSGNMDNMNQQLNYDALLYSWYVPGTPRVYSFAMSSSTSSTGLREVFVSDYQTLSVFDWNKMQQDAINQQPLASTYAVTDLATELLPTTGELIVTINNPFVHTPPQYLTVTPPTSGEFFWNQPISTVNSSLYNPFPKAINLDTKTDTMYWIDTRHSTLSIVPMNAKEEATKLSETYLVVPSSQILFDTKRSEVVWADDGAAIVKRCPVYSDEKELASYSIAITGMLYSTTNQTSITMDPIAHILFMTGYDETTLHSISLPEDPRVPVTQQTQIFTTTSLKVLAGQPIDSIAVHVARQTLYVVVGGSVISMTYDGQMQEVYTYPFEVEQIQIVPSSCFGSSGQVDSTSSKISIQ